jgi:hypothetical protein
VEADACSTGRGSRGLRWVGGRARGTHLAAVMATSAVAQRSLRLADGARSSLLVPGTAEPATAGRCPPRAGWARARLGSVGSAGSIGSGDGSLTMAPATASPCRPAARPLKHPTYESMRSLTGSEADAAARRSRAR